MSQTTLINLAPTGMVAGKKQNPSLPVSVEEIVTEVALCVAEGVSIVHLHARDEAGKPTSSKEIYARLIGGIREACGDELIICVSLSGRLVPDLEQRMQPLLLTGDLQPDMASLTMSSMNFSKSASVNSPETILKLASAMAERGIKPELEIFDAGMLNYARYMADRQILTPPYYFNFILGGVASLQASPLAIGMLQQELPEQSIWCGGGLGAAQLPMNVMGLLYGHGVRVGLEDNLWLDPERNKEASNFELVRRVRNLAETLGREVATPAQARQALGLPQKPAKE